MPKQKKTYQPPKIESEKIIEESALGCAKCTSGNPITQGRCRSLPARS